MKITRKIFCLVSAVFMCVSLAACSGAELKTVYELPYYDGSEYDDVTNKPIYSTDLWRRNEDFPDVGDPMILDNRERDGFYYLYKTQGFGNYFEAMRSTDLLNWYEAGWCCVMPEGWSCAWAPEVVYDEETELYYFFFSAMPANAQNLGAYAYSNGMSLYVGTAKNAYGPFEIVDFTSAKQVGSENVRNIARYDESWAPFVKHVLFDPIETNEKLAEIRPEIENYVTGDNAKKLVCNIDPSPFVDPVTKKKYLVFSGDKQPSPILGIEMENWLTPKLDTLTVLTQCGYYTTADFEKEQNGEDVETIWYEKLTNKVNEGPFLYYRNGTYYLTTSVNGYTDAAYSVVQAVSDSPMGPFRKLTESENGVILSGDFNGNKAVSGTGHHSFVEIGEKLYIAYHRHVQAGSISKGRCLAMDEVKFMTIDDINGEKLDVMYVNGPTITVQPGIVETLEYEDISNRGTLSLVKGALEKNSDLKWFNDGLLSYNVNFNQEFLDKYVRETVITNDTTFEFSFEDYEGVRGLMIYNSKYKEKIFKKVKNIEFISEENGAEKVWYIKELNLDTKTNCFYNQFDLENGIETLEAVTYGGGVWAEFKEINVKKIRFTVEVPEGQESVGLSEIAVMGRKR